MDQQHVFNLVLGIGAGLSSIILVVLSWWAKTIWADVVAQKIALVDLERKMIENYPTKNDIERSLDKLFSKVDDISKEVQHIARNQTNLRQLRDMIETQHTVKP